MTEPTLTHIPEEQIYSAEYNECEGRGKTEIEALTNLVIAVHKHFTHDPSTMTPYRLEDRKQ